MIAGGCRYWYINKLRDNDNLDKLAFMELFRKTKKSTLYFWVIFLSIALVCAQGVTLHVHVVDHEHHHHHNHDSLLGQTSTVEHTHISVAHLSTDTSHSNHHDQVIYESDACPDCLLTKISNKAPFAALLSVLFILTLIGVYRYTYDRRRIENIHLRYLFHFAPPLRAPPFN